jgi:hypothetical protein
LEDGWNSRTTCNETSRSLVPKPRSIGNIDNEIKKDGKKVVAAYTERLGASYGTKCILAAPGSLLKDRNSTIELQTNQKETNVRVVVPLELEKAANGKAKSPRSGHKTNIPCRHRSIGKGGTRAGHISRGDMPSY